MFAGDIGTSLAEVGKAGGEVATGMIARMRQDALIGATKQALDGKIYWQDRIRQMQKDAPPGADGFAKSVDDAFDKWSVDALNAQPNGMQRAALDLRYQALRAQLHSDAADFEDRSHKQNLSNQIEEYTDKSQGLVYGKFDELGPTIAEGIKLIHQSNLDADVQDKLAYDMTRGLTESAWLGQGRRDPYGTRDMMARGDVPGLSFASRIRIFNETNAVIRADEAEKRQEARIAAAEAKAAQQQKMAEDRAIIDERRKGLADQRAAGLPVKGEDAIKPGEVMAAYGPRLGPHVWAEIQSETAAANATGVAKNMSFPEQETMLAGMRPTATDPILFHQQTVAYDAALKVVHQARTAFAEDPATYTIRAVPAVANAFEAAKTDPSKAGAAVALLMRNEALIDPEGAAAGKLHPMPKETASDTVAAFNNAESADQRLAIVAPWTLGLGDDVLGRKSLDQMEAAGLPHGVDRVLDAERAGEHQRARDLMGLIGTKPGDVPDIGDAKAGQVANEVGALYRDPNLAMAESQGARLTGQPGAATTANEGYALTLQVAKTLAARDGLDAHAAAAKAYQIVYGGGRTTTNPDVGVVRLPPGQTSDTAFTAGLTAIRGNVNLEHLQPTREGVERLLTLQTGQPPLPGQVEGALARAQHDHEAWVRDMRQNARWVGAPNGYQLVLPSGQAVPDANGHARVWTAEQVMAASGSAPPRMMPRQGVPVPGSTPPGAVPPAALPPDATPPPYGPGPPTATVPNPFIGGGAGNP